MYLFDSGQTKSVLTMIMTALLLYSFHYLSFNKSLAETKVPFDSYGNQTFRQCIINNVPIQKRNSLNAFVFEYLRLSLMSVN